MNSSFLLSVFLLYFVKISEQSSSGEEHGSIEYINYRIPDEYRCGLSNHDTLLKYEEYGLSLLQNEEGDTLKIPKDLEKYLNVIVRLIKEYLDNVVIMYSYSSLVSNEDIILAIIGYTKLNISSKSFCNQIYERCLETITDQLDSATDKDSCVKELHNSFKSVDENYTKYTKISGNL